MTLSRRMLANYMMGLRGKSTHTLPERQFNAYQESRGMALLWDVSLKFVDDDDGQEYDFQCDFLRPTDRSYDVDFEVDGEKFHTSSRQMQKDDWKDRLKNRQGLKVIHIPAILTQKRHWSYLDAQIANALLVKQRSVRIAA